MKKITLIVLLFMGVSAAVSAQATKELNFGIIGVGFDIPVATDIAITPFAGTNLDLSYLNLGVKASYYFDNLIGFSESWDLYAGLGVGFAVKINNNNDNSSGLDIGLHVGGRWFWSPKWGIYAEIGGGHHTGGTGGLGLTMRL